VAQGVPERRRLRGGWVRCYGHLTMGMTLEKKGILMSTTAISRSADAMMKLLVVTPNH